MKTDSAQSSPENRKPVTLNYNQIVNLLPHRHPFLLVDKVIDMVPYDFIHAIKSVSGLDPYFPGHFPGNPVMPGVLMVEGLAQASGLLAFQTFVMEGKTFEPKCVLTGIDEAKFRKQVVPGDVIHYHVKFEKSRGPFAWFSGEVKVEGEVVAEARWSALLSNPFGQKAKS